MLYCFVSNKTWYTSGGQKWFIMIFHRSKTCHKEDCPNLPSSGLLPQESWYKQPAADGGVVPTNEDPDYHSQYWWFRTPVNRLGLVVYLTMYDIFLATSQVPQVGFSESFAVSSDSKNSPQMKSGKSIRASNEANPPLNSSLCWEVYWIHKSSSLCTQGIILP